MDESKWNIIPANCKYKDKVYRILNIDMQGGYFTLHNVQAQKGEVQVLENIDMDECDPVEDWEIAYHQVFPCIDKLDKETQSHFKDGFMEGYKFKKTE